MPLILTAGPAAEPVSLAEAKAHCRIDGDAEDTVIASLILAARMHIERSLDLALIAQSWSLYLDRWPDAPWTELPLAPVATLDAVRLYSETGTFVTLNPALFQLDSASRRARLIRTNATAWPEPGRRANGIEIAFSAGYGPTANDVPMPIRLAIKMLVAHWYEAREPVSYSDPASLVPMSVSGLLGPYREARL